MSIYIKGMEMPTKCAECKLMVKTINYDLDFVCMPEDRVIEDKVKFYKQRADWCPLCQGKMEENK